MRHLSSQWEHIWRVIFSRWVSIANRTKANANRDFIWITRELYPGVWPNPKTKSSQTARSFSQCRATSKIIHHGFCFFSVFTFFFLALKSTLPFSSLLSCDRKFSQLPTKVTVHGRRQQGPAWPSLNTQLRRDFVNSQQTKDAAPHLKVSAT